MACHNKLTRYHLYVGIFSVLQTFPFFVAQYLPGKALPKHRHFHLHQRRPFWSCAGAEVFGIAVSTECHALLRWPSGDFFHGASQVVPARTLGTLPGVFARQGLFFKNPKIPNANDCLNIVRSTSFSLKKSDRAWRNIIRKCNLIAVKSELALFFYCLPSIYVLFDEIPNKKRNAADIR